MKAPKIMWPALLIIAGLTCWFTSPKVPAAPTRIKVENDVNDIANMSGNPASARGSSYDAYFIQENRMPIILVTVNESK